ncbi:MAG: FAD-dependent oxidoreductase [Lachnospiraceae bacterium]|jgi:thioredoxin reductase (NADPH)|nr:FAD-dependent oxidoreductase [Lachnospiraceae bacterium]
MRDLIIIGSGPAGLSAAVYAKRAALDTLVLDASPVSGGQVLNTYEVDNYLGLPGISGYDMGMKFKEHADRLGCEFAEATVTSIERICGVDKVDLDRVGTSELRAAGRPETECRFIVRSENGDFETRALIIASGASHARLGVPGEDALVGAGVSYCATCDGAFFRKKTVAVVGGGDVAVEDAIFLARGCAKVYLIHRRDELRAAAILQKALMELPNVEIIWDTVVEAIEGNGQVEGVRLKKVKNGEVFSQAVDGVFIAVGILPNSKAFGEAVTCNEQGYIIAGEDCASNVPGIFVAGDVRTKRLRQIITAVADGACAVTGVQHYLLG